MVQRIMLLIIAIVFLCNCSAQQCKSKTQIVYVPVYKSPLDNITLIKKPIINKFEFSDNGSLCLDDNNYQILITNLINLKQYSDWAEDILNTLKK